MHFRGFKTEFTLQSYTSFSRQDEKSPSLFKVNGAKENRKRFSVSGQLFSLFSYFLNR